jgi:hypothetical protein
MSKDKLPSGQFLNLDSLVDIVTNSVGILIILTAFMALSATVSPDRRRPAAQPAPPAAAPPRTLLVPWSHPTSKQTVFLALRENRILLLDLKRFYEQLLDAAPSAAGLPQTFNQPGVKVRYFPVTSQVYCLEFTPDPGAGEAWAEAQRPGSAWQRTLSRYPREQYVYFFWVDGGSFERFRNLRQGLWDRQVEVGWKPVLPGAPLEMCTGFEGSNTFQPQ